MCLLCALTWSGEAWGYSNSGLTVKVVGGGQVAITSNTNAPSTYSSGPVNLEQGPHGFWDTTVRDYYYIWVKPNSGFQAVSMSGDFSSSEVKTSGYYAVSFEGKTSRVNKTVTITFQTTYKFSATANTNGASYGTASASVANSSITTTATSSSTTATFTATPKNGYEFQGWGTSSTATTYESTNNPYKPANKNQ